MITTMAIVIGFIIDLLAGDPPALPHPVRWMGQAVTWLERELRKALPSTPKGQLAGGLILTIVMAGGTLGISGLVLFGAAQIHWGVRLGVESIMAWQCLAATCLAKEAKKVYRALCFGDVGQARKALSLIVGRDTDRLDQQSIARATIETVAENTSDGVIAPLLFLIMGGGAWGLFYKAVNTMDSMIGYKNEQYYYFGRIAAKTDDVVNFIPARVCAGLMLLCCPLSGLDGKNALAIWKRDRFNHSSPNSGQSESVCAGALHIQLGGTSHYFGKPVYKPTIGNHDRPVHAGDIVKANKLMRWASVLGLVLFLLVRIAVLWVLYGI